jgi:PAS domain S-box-containing protein
VTTADTPAANILLVDDTDENLVALEATLEPLGQNLIMARSGEEALRHLLHDEVAVILLDVRMPGLSGFETAELIKQRERTKTIPIIFMTAFSEDERQVFQGYSAGAVDYLFKPFDPDVLRSKVAVFIELHAKNEQLRDQAERLAAQELAAVRRESEERYRQLADAMPQIVWMAGSDGKAMYYNRRWYEYTGLEPGTPHGDEWVDVVHPDDLGATLDRRTATLETGDVFEVQYRFRAADGSYRWHLARAVPIRVGAQIDFWVGTATDIDDQKRIEQAQDFLLRAGAELAATLDYRAALQAVARLAVPEIADWCAIDLVQDDDRLVPLALAHVDPAKVAFARELQERYPGGPDSVVASSVIRRREAQLVPEIPDEALAEAAVDELHLELMRELGLRSFVCVPVVSRERAVAAITFAAAESGRKYAPEDLRLAEELARRTGVAIENAELYQEVEERARAARVLSAVGDGVFLVDASGRVRLWNIAASTITGLAADDVVGRPAVEAIPGWETIEPRIPVSEFAGPAVAESVPLEVRGRELWLSISSVALEEGTVYAFRDLTEDRALEAIRQDLVATVSHELRTPLAAIYGSALTLRREDIGLEEEMQEKLLEIIVEESSRLADIVNDLLLASQLDAGTLQVAIERCDASEIARAVVEAASTHLPPNVSVELVPPEERAPAVAADPGQLRQVLENVIENAVKYSPDGGTVRVGLVPAGRYLRFSIADEGLGVPSAERARIFEKFYRLDPDMTRGIGGTGLGLYICRELVRRVDGRIWVEPKDGRGSVFFVDIPFAAEPQKPRRPREAAMSTTSGAGKSVANRITNG